MRRAGLGGIAAAAALGALAQAPSPPFALNDPALLKAVCGPLPCKLEFVGNAPVPAGAPAVSLVRWPLCDSDDDAEIEKAGLRDMQADGGCGIGYFRVEHRAGKVGAVRVVAAHSNAGLTGYGAGGGEESVEFDPKTGLLVHEVQGGSGWRWAHGRSWRMVPQVALDSFSESQSWRMNLEWGRDLSWDARQQVLKGSLASTACRFDAKRQRWISPVIDNVETLSAEYADAPLVADKRFDWRKSPLPNWLEVRADAQPGPRRHSVVLTRTSMPASPLAMRLAWIGHGALLVELDGTGNAPPATRVELWWWDEPDDGSRRCIVPPPAAARAKSPPDAESGGFEVHVARGVRQVLVAPDGTVSPAYGKPEPEAIMVERATVDGRPRLLLRWNLPGAKPEDRFEWPYAVALSTTVDKRQHLVSHAALRFADPTSFAWPLHKNPAADPNEVASAWGEMVSTRFPSAPRKK